MCHPPLKLQNDPPNPLRRGGRGLQLLFEQCTNLGSYFVCTNLGSYFVCQIAMRRRIFFSRKL